MENSILSISVFISCFLAVRTANQHVSNSTDTTVKPRPNFDTMYRDILQVAIEILWVQQAHLFQIKVRESRVRRKSKQGVPKMQDLILETKTLIMDELAIQAERFWNPKANQLHILPMVPNRVEMLIKSWKKFDELVDSDLQSRENVEKECKEIRDEVCLATTNLPILYEEMKEQMKILEEVKNSMKKDQKKKS